MRYARTLMTKSLLIGAPFCGEREHPQAVVARLEQRPGEAAGRLVELEAGRDLAADRELRRSERPSR